MHYRYTHRSSASPGVLLGSSISVSNHVMMMMIMMMMMMMFLLRPTCFSSNSNWVCSFSPLSQQTSVSLSSSARDQIKDNRN